VIVFPVVNFTLATFLLAEFGFFGLAVKICVQTPFFWKQPSRAGDLESLTFFLGFWRMDWLSVIDREEIEKGVGGKKTERKAL